MEEKNRKSGINIIGDVHWGTHFCLFYQIKEDLLDILVPYFKAGLENNEFCMWVTSEPLINKDAEKAMRNEVPHFDQYQKKGQIEIIPYEEWYLKDGVFNSQRVLNGWIDKLNQALDNGYDGMRLTGNTFWLNEMCWNSFTEYQEEVNSLIKNYRMIAICAYSLDRCGASEIIEVVDNHEFALIRKKGTWSILESSENIKLKKTLYATTEKYRSFVQNFHGIAFYRHIDFTPIFMHGVLEEITGYTEEMFISESVKWDRIIHHDDLKGLSESFEKMRSIPGYSTVNEYRIISKDGQVRWIQEYCQNLCDDSGKPIIVRGAIYDISERKKMLENLQQEKEYSESLINSSLDMIISVDPDRKIMEFNSAAEKAFGYTKEEVLGKHINILYADPSQGLQVHKATLKDSGFEGEILNKRKNGKIFISYLSSSVLRDTTGALIGIMGISRDITGRKMAEEELKKRESFNYALFEYNPIETIVVDREGKIVRTNLAKRKSGNRLPKLGNIMYKDYAGKHEIDMYAELMSCIKTGKVKKFLEQKYGNKFLSITISPFPQGAIIISQDITMSKKDEEELKESKLKLQRQKSVLEQKNIALREVIGQIEVEKKAVEDNIMANVNKMILPVLEKIKLKDESDEYAEFINLIEQFSKKLSSSFGREITKPSLKLTPREIEICTLIENGLRNKEISKFLNISYLTVDDYRKKIRKKLGITNKRINLTTFLRNLSS